MWVKNTQHWKVGNTIKVLRYMTLINKLYINIIAGASDTQRKSQRVVSLFWFSFSLGLFLLTLIDIIGHCGVIDLSFVFNQKRYILKMYVIVSLSIIYFILSFIYSKERTTVLLSEFSATPKERLRLSLIFSLSPFIFIFSYLIIRSFIFN